MTDVFGFESNKWGGTSFKKGDSGAMFSAGGDISLVQQWNVNYQLNIQQIYECGSGKVYFAAPTPQGTATIARIVDGVTGITDKYRICNPESLTIKAKETCDGSGRGVGVSNGVTITIGGAVLSGVGWSGNSQNAYVDENVTLTFIRAEVEYI